MMTPQEGSKLCIKMAGYGIRPDVVKAIQDDARRELLEQLDIHNMKEKCNVCGQSYSPSLIESGHCIFCIRSDYKEMAKQLEECERMIVHDASKCVCEKCQESKKKDVDVLDY